MSNSNRGAAVVVHGGAGSARSADDGCQRAAAGAMDLLGAGGDALDAVVAAVSIMEDDERFNAGTGSELSLDGVTVEMDAALMDTRGRLGAVAALRSVKNPVQVARAVADTPHHFICGEGAQRLARALGFGPHDPVTARARQRHAELLTRLAGTQAAMAGVANADFARFWNYPAPFGPACDTVGAVARGPDGHFAVAGSTGGSTPALLGRVGDTPLIGCGFFAGPQGAVAATGVGEHIMRHLLAREVYQWIVEGLALEQALQRGVDLFDPAVSIGLIGITREATAVCANRDMAHAVLTHE